MKAISLWQPWASYVAIGLKTIETRGHDRFRWLKGRRIAIHAARRWDYDAFDHTGKSFEIHRWIPRGFRELEPEGCPFGAVVCTVDVVDFIRLDGSDDLARKCLCRQDETRFGLVLDGIVRLEMPIPVLGRQGIFEVEVQGER